MTKEKIEEAYKIGEKYIMHTFTETEIAKDLIQIGIQMALQGEVVFDENDIVMRIE